MIKHLRIALITITVLIALLPQAYGQQKSRHIFFWTHGIGGTADQFGSLPLVLKRELNGEVLFFPYEYETASDLKSVPEFQTGFNNFVNSKLSQIGGLQETDQITIGGYSQGGIIVFKWLLSLSESVAPADQKILSSVHNFITVSTPYWGANIANIGKALKPFFGSWTPLSQFGKRQLEDMSIGSEAVFAMAHSLSSNKMIEKIQSLTQNIRFLQINGYFLPSTLSSLFPETLILDEDLAVNDYSTPLSFFSYLEKSYSPENKTIVETSDFKAPNFAIEARTAEGWHLTDVKKVLGRAAEYFPSINPPSMVDVPSSCLDVPMEKCRSGSAQLIVNFVNQKPLEPLISIHRRYSLVIKVHLTSHGLQAYDLAEHKTIQIETEDSLNNNSHNLSVTDSQVIRQFTGRLKTGSVETFKLKIQAPGYTSKEVNAPVSSGKSTLIEIYLEKIL
jgi:hypothetical protein